MTNIRFDNHKVNAYVYNKHINSVDLTKTVYVFYPPKYDRDYYKGNYTHSFLFISNAPFEYQFQKNYLREKYEYKYDWKHVIALPDTPEIRAKLTSSNWILMEQYHRERPLYTDSFSTSTNMFLGRENKTNFVFYGTLDLLWVLWAIAYPNILSLVYIVVVALINRRYYKINRSMFVVQHVSEDCFMSKRLGRTLCRVQRNQPIYYRVLQLGDYTHFVKSYVLLSNEPIYVRHESGDIFAYNEEKQILMPYSSDTAAYFDFEHWIAV